MDSYFIILSFSWTLVVSSSTNHVTAAITKFTSNCVMEKPVRVREALTIDLQFLVFNLVLDIMEEK